MRHGGRGESGHPYLVGLFLRRGKYRPEEARYGCHDRGKSSNVVGTRCYARGLDSVYFARLLGQERLPYLLGGTDYNN